MWSSPEAHRAPSTGRRGGGDQAADGPDAGSELGQVGGQVIGGGVERLVGRRVERVEDEQRPGGVLAQPAALAPATRARSTASRSRRRCRARSPHRDWGTSTTAMPSATVSNGSVPARTSRGAPA